MNLSSPLSNFIYYDEPDSPDVTVRFDWLHHVGSGGPSPRRVTAQSLTAPPATARGLISTTRQSHAYIRALRGRLKPRSTSSTTSLGPHESLHYLAACVRSHRCAAPSGSPHVGRGRTCVDDRRRGSPRRPLAYPEVARSIKRCTSRAIRSDPDGDRAGTGWGPERTCGTFPDGAPFTLNHFRVLIAVAQAHRDAYAHERKAAESAWSAGLPGKPRVGQLGRRANEIDPRRGSVVHGEREDGFDLRAVHQRQAGDSVDRDRDRRLLTGYGLANDAEQDRATRSAPYTGLRGALTIPRPSLVSTTSGSRTATSAPRSSPASAAMKTRNVAWCSAVLTCRRGAPRRKTCLRARAASWRTAAGVRPPRRATSAKGSRTDRAAPMLPARPS
jgi:hypothetical protein